MRTERDRGPYCPRSLPNEGRRIRRHHTPMSLAPSWLNPARSRDGVLSEPKEEEDHGTDRTLACRVALARAKPQLSSETQEQRFSQARRLSLPAAAVSRTRIARSSPRSHAAAARRVHARALHETAGNRTPGVAVGLTCLIKNSGRPPALALPSAPACRLPVTGSVWAGSQCSLGAASP